MFQNLQKIIQTWLQIEKKSATNIFSGVELQKLMKFFKDWTKINALKHFLEVLKHFLRFLNIFWTFLNIF